MKSKIKVIGEIALRVIDLGKMTEFYENAVGLEVMRRSEGMTFFRIAEGFGGHTQILALFDRSAEADYQGIERRKSTLDHFAFTLDLKDFEAEKKRIEDLGIEVGTAEHAWVQWRSLYFSDPEGNQVEFVCYDRTIQE